LNENYKADNGASVSANMQSKGGLVESVKATHMWHVECIAPDGSLKWETEYKNLVTDEGLDLILTEYWKGSGYTAAHYVALTDGTPTVAAGDTMASHAGWVEVTAYSEGTREILTLGTVSGESVNNSASKASFAINANSTTIGGAVITTNSTKGGSTGTLVAGGAFSVGDKSADSGDTLNVTVTLSMTSS